MSYIVGDKNTTQHPALWDLVVLCLLREHPMHPYEMQRLLKERHKDDVMVLKRGSLYHAIERLLRARLIVPIETSREGKRPERTIYRITPEGGRAQLSWLQAMIAIPRREHSSFMASLSLMVYLVPKDACAQLETRAQNLEQQIAGWEATLKSIASWLPRIHLVEVEYLVAMLRAEFRWVQSLATDLKSGDLTWDLKAILKEAAEAASSPKEKERHR